MNNMPEISVVIPIYNTEVFLEECLNSLKMQSFDRFEVILVNDGSNDGSGKICEDVAKSDPRFKVIHKPNGGVNTARKLGIELARGKYITFVDSDDLLTRDALLNMYLKAEEYNLDICVGSLYTWTQKEDKPTVENFIYNNEQKYTKVFNAKDLDYFHLYEIEWFMIFWGKLFKKNLFNNQYIATHLKYGEDQICVKECLFKANRIMVLPELTYIYRKRANSATTRRNKNAFDIFESFSFLEKVLTDYGYIEKEYSHLVNFALVSFKFHLKLYIPYIYWWAFVSKIGDYIKIIDLNKIKEDEIDIQNLKLIKRFKKKDFLFFRKLYFIYKIIFRGS